ncbi:hypothetical protein TURU_123200 [Turdus rufiventris]|nr:hypothetical protein TURU_123200 [Turdus rufiventris]
MDKAEMFNAFFASVFNIDDGPRGSQCLELEDYDCKNDQLPVNPELVRDLLLQLDPYKSMEPDEIHPIILKVLACVIAKPLSMIFECSWKSREIPADWKLDNIVPIFQKSKKEDPGKYSNFTITSRIDYKLHLRVSATFRSLSIHKPHLIISRSVVRSENLHATKLPISNRITGSRGLLARSGLPTGPGGPARHYSSVGPLGASRGRAHSPRPAACTAAFA